MASLPAMCMSHVAGFHQQFHLFLAEAKLHSPERHGGVAGAPNMLLTLCEVVLAGNLLEKGDSMEEQPTKPWSPSRYQQALWPGTSSVCTPSTRRVRSQSALFGQLARKSHSLELEASFHACAGRLQDWPLL